MDSKSKHFSGEQPEVLQPFSVYTHFHTSPTKGVTMNQPKINSFSFATHLFLLLFLLNPTTGNLIYDRQALLDFSSTVPHGRKLNWDLATPICTSWVGVTCTSDGTRVLALRLPGIGLSGPIPAQTLGKLDALRILSLRSNRLSGSLPSDISTLPSLHYLFLQHNNFSGDIPDSLSPDLNVLDLSFNSLTGNIPLTFQKLTQLTGLSLQNNSLSGPIPDINLPKLRHLNLSNNNLNGSVPSSLQRFPNSSFTGNSHLCLSNCSPVIPSPSPSPSSLPPPAIFPKENERSRKKLGTRIIIAIAVGGAATLILLVLLISVCCLRKKESHGVSKGKPSVGGRSEKPKEVISGIALPLGSDKLFSAGSKDKSVRVWNCHTGQCASVITMEGEIGCMISGGPWIFVGLPNVVKAWNTQTNSTDQITTLSCGSSSGQVFSLAVANEMLLAGTQDGSILAWRFTAAANSFELAASLTGHKSAVVSLAVGANNRLYSGSMDHTMREWDLATLQCIQTLTEHTSVVMSVLCWDEFLISCSLDKTIKVWAATESGNLEVTYTHKEEHGGILTLCGMHDEQAKPVLLCACNDNTVRLYDLPSFNERGKIFAKEEIREIQISPWGIFFTGNANGELKVGSGRSASAGRVIYNDRNGQPTSRGSSPGPRARPVHQPIVLPDFPLDIPPNLRTTLPDRPISAGRSRPGATTATARGNSEANGLINPQRRQSSPVITRGRLPELSGKNRLHANGYDNGAHEDRKMTPANELLQRRATKSATATENTGYGRTISKRSLDPALRHMDIRPGSGNIRPVSGSTLFPQSIRNGKPNGRSPHILGTQAYNGGPPISNYVGISKNGNYIDRPSNGEYDEENGHFSARLSEPVQCNFVRRGPKEHKLATQF